MSDPRPPHEQKAVLPPRPPARQPGERQTSISSGRPRHGSHGEDGPGPAATPRQRLFDDVIALKLWDRLVESPGRSSGTSPSEPENRVGDAPPPSTGALGRFHALRHGHRVAPFLDPPPLLGARSPATVALSRPGPFGLQRLGEGTALLLVVVLAAALRFFWLGEIPDNITADEADNLQVVFRIQERQDPGLFGLDWKPAPAFSLHLANAFMAVFGDDVFGLRSASAAISTLALIPFFALARRAVGFPAAIAATALLGSSRWYLHFSRSGWENVQGAGFALLAAWAVAVGRERAQLRWFVLGGVAAALGLYGYFAGRLILPAMLAYAPVAWWTAWGRHRRVVNTGRGPRKIATFDLGSRLRARRTALGMVLLLVVAVGLFIPQLVASRDRWADFTRRSDAVAVLNQPRPYLGEETALGIVLVQLRRAIDGFFLRDGGLFPNGRYGPVGTPPFDLVTWALLAVGLAVGLRRWRVTALWWSLLLVPLVGTQVFTAGTPDLARGAVFIPFLYLFAALGLDVVLRRACRRPRLVPLVATVIVVVGGGANVAQYARWIRTPEALAARQPAVELADYPAWERYQRCAMRAGGAGFDVQIWYDDRQQELRAQPVLEPEDPAYCRPSG